MIDTKLRKFFQPIFAFLARPFVVLGIHPDAITLASFLLGIAASLAIGTGKTVLPLILLWVSGLLDVLDGTVARETGKSSRKGAYLDLVFDRMVESAIILSFYLLAPEHALAYLLFFVAVLFNFTTFIIAGALFANTGSKSMHYDNGLVERTETFIVFTLMVLFRQQVPTILLIFDIIIMITGILRFVRILRSEES